MTILGESPLPLPLISDKDKRDLWKLFSEKESCLSHTVPCKSEEVLLQALFCLKPLGLENDARDPLTALWILKSRAHIWGLTTAALQSVATSCTVVTAKPSTPPDVSFWRWQPLPKKLPDTFPPRCSTSYTCRFTLLFSYLVILFNCLAAIQIYSRITLLTLI